MRNRCLAFLVELRIINQNKGRSGIINIVLGLFSDLAFSALVGHGNLSSTVGAGVFNFGPLTQAHAVEYVLLGARKHVYFAALLYTEPTDGASSLAV